MKHPLLTNTLLPLFSNGLKSTFSLVLCTFFLFIFSIQHTYAQCTPTISAAGGIVTYCVTENIEINLMADVTPSRDSFFGPGVTHPAGIDNTATFNPSVAGAGMISVSYVVQSADADCMIGEVASLTIMVVDSSFAGDDGAVSVCDDGSSTVTLFNHLTGIPDGGGTWMGTVATSNGDNGDLSALDINTLAVGVHTYKYIVGGTAPCANDTAIVTLTVLPAPSPTSIDAIAAVCENEMAAVQINGLADGNYLVEYNIAGSTETPATLTVSGGSSSFNTRSLLIGDTGDPLNVTKVTNVDVTPNCEVTVFYTENVTVNPLPTATLASDDIDNTICDGDQVVFTATGGLTYEFFLNNNSLGAASATATYTTDTLNNGDAVKVAAFDINGCSDTTIAIATIVDALPVPIIASDDVDNAICDGDQVIFTETSGTGNSFQFLVNELVVQAFSADNTYDSNTLNNSDAVKVVVVNAAGCQDTSSAIITTVNAIPTAGITSSDADDEICAGEEVIFTGSGGVTYEFFLNNVSLGAASATTTYTTDTLNNGDAVKVAAFSNGCSDTTTVISTIVNALPTPTLVSDDADSTICAGDVVVFTETSASGNNYEFLVNNVSAQALSGDDTYDTGALSNGDLVSVIVVNADMCTDTSDAIPFTVDPALTATIMSSVGTTICQGDSVIFKGTGGSTYEFFLNDVSLGAPSIVDSLITTTLNHNDLIKVAIFNAGGCTDTTTNITMTVNALPIITLSSDDADNSICAGDDVLFTGTSTTGDFQFLVNEVAIGAASATATYMTDTLNTMDAVKMVSVDGNGCTDTTTAIITTVNPLPIPTLAVNDTDSTICDGTTAIFTAGGSDTYAFLLNDASVQGPNGTTVYANNTLLDLDEIEVIVSNSVTGCFDTSGTIIMMVSAYPTATLTSDDADDSICEGDMVTFTGTGGATYEFFLNNVSLGAASATPTYQTDTLNSGDAVKVAAFNADGCSDTTAVISTTVNALPTLALIGSDPDMTICEGDNVTFTAGTGTMYEFLLNDVSIGAASATMTYQTDTLNNGDQVEAIVTNAAGCFDTTSMITMVVNPLPTPTIASSDADNIICAGDTVTFTAGGGTMYEFLLNNASVGAASAITTYKNSTLTNGDMVSVVVTDVNSCSDTSSVITTTVNPLPIPTIASDDGDNTICQGDTVTFSAGGGMTYEFLVNNNSVAAASATTTYQTDTLNNGDMVAVIVTNANGCIDTSSAIINIVNPLPTPTLSSDDVDNAICVGDTVVFTAGGGTMYEFLLNNVSISAASATTTYQTDTLNNGDMVAVIVTNANGCIDTSSIITTTVNALPIPTLVSSDGDNTICDGELVVFTAAGGTAYEFLLNNVSIGAASASNLYNTDTLNTGDEVAVIVANAGACVDTSIIINTTVNPVPTSTLSSSDGDNTICEGDTVTFTAGGGTMYEFLLNNVSLGAASAVTTYQTDTLNNGDGVEVIVTNGLTCFDTSAVINTVVNALPIATLSSSDVDNTICDGDTVTFTASGGAMYEFFLNGTSLGVATAMATYQTDTLNNGDAVMVIVANAAGCIDTSIVITTVVNAVPIAGLTSSDLDNVICEADTVTFTGTGGTTYEFLLNNTSLGVATAVATYQTDTLNNGDFVNVIAMANGCVDTSANINMIVIPKPIPTLSINDLDSTICAGDTVLFTAGGGTMYEFLLNGTSLGVATAVATYQTDTLNNGDIVRVVVSNASGCIDTSGMIIMIVNAIPVAGLTSSDGDNEICEDEIVTFTASGVGTYEFFLNNVSIGAASATATYPTDSLNNGDLVYAMVVNANGCVDTSAVITTTVNPKPIAGNITGPTQLCMGSAITLIPDTSSGTSPLTVSWLSSDISIATVDINTGIVTPVDTGNVNISYAVSDAKTCNAISSFYAIRVDSIPTASLSASTTTICAGDSITFTGAGGLTYEFLVNTLSQGAPSAIDTFTTTALMNGDIVQVVVADGNMCTDTSAMIIITVNPLPTAGISSDDADNEICAGTTVIFTGTGGTDYEFFLNDVSLGAASATTTYTTDSLNNGDRVKVAVFSASGCVDTSANIMTLVNQNPAAANITGPAQVCMGSTINLNSSESGGTGALTINWLSSDNGVATVASGGIVTPVDTGNVNVSYSVSDTKGCSAISNGYLIRVDSIPTPGLIVSDIDSTICQDDLVIFTASGGSTYEFLLNNTSIAAASATTTYTTDTLNNGDQIKVVVNNSFGCSDTSGVVLINVNPLPTSSLVSNDADNNIGTGQSVEFTATGGTNYIFSINNTVVQAYSLIDTFETNTIADLDTVRVEVFDANGCRDTTSIVMMVNSLPTALNDTITLPEDSLYISHVLVNDTDPEMDPLSVTIITNAANGVGSVVVTNDSIQYTPTGDYNGLDSISYAACDAFNNCDTALLFITVTPVNDTPFVANENIIILEDSALDTFYVQANDGDIDGDAIITSIFSGPNKGTAVVIGGSGISYVPLPDSTGIDVIVYEITDPFGASEIGILTIQITPINDSPVAVKDSVLILEDSMNISVAILANDFDVDGDVITLDSVFAASAGGTFTVSNDTIIYTPTANFNGLDSIKYKICDATLCDSTYLIFNVIPFNEKPIAVKDSISVPEDTVNVKIAFIANDIDVDGDSLRYDSVFAATSGATVVLTNDTICYTPPANFNGLDSIQYIVTDTIFRDTNYVIINVESVNDAPIAINDTAMVLENAVNHIIPVQANDSDVDAGALFGTTLIPGGGPTQGTATVAGGNILYTPPTSFNGTDSILYSICDIGTPQLCDTAMVYIIVNGTNDKPVALNDSICVPEDTTAVLVAITLNDSDIENDPFTVNIITSATNAMVDSIRDDTMLVYIPSPDFEGIDSIYYELSDGFAKDSAWVIITVKARNDAPIAVRDSITVIEDATNVQLAILQNDIEIDAGDSIKATIAVAPTSGGTATILNDTLLVYTPPMDFVGVDTIVYEICDTSLVCDRDTIIAIINSTNDRPVAVDDYLTVLEDAMNVIIDVQDNDSDGDGDPLITTIINTVMTADTLNGDSIIFTTQPDFSGGVQTILYKICDTTGLCDTALVYVTVTPVNDPPVAVNDILIITMDTTNVMVDVIGNDTDIDDPVLTIGTGLLPSALHGTVAIVNDSLLYNPTPNYSGLDTIYYQVCDSSNACVPGIVLVTVGFVNTPPVANNDPFTLNEDVTALALNVVANDTDVNGLGDSLKVVSLTMPTQGTAVINGDSTINYTPFADFNGTDSLQYTVCDTSVGCATAWIYLTINPVNDAPVAVNDTFSLAKDTVNAILVVKDDDTDIDGDALIISVIGVSTQGVTTYIVGENIVYSAPASFLGIDTVTYQVYDGALYDTAIAIISIVDPNNVVPIANADFVTSVPGTTINIDVQDNDVDGNGDLMVTSIISGPAAGNTATVLNGDSIAYTAMGGFVGNDRIVYQVCDPSLTCDSDTIFITVENTLAVAVKVYLGGAMGNGGLLMQDSLRKQGIIPTTEPYTNLPFLANAYQFIHKNGGGGETIANPATVFADNGANSIVDWVYVELLRAIDTIPVASRSALLQRDGDVVEIDGVSTLKFDLLPDGNYFLSIRHRNHLGVMTKTAIPFASGSFTTINFTTGLDVYGSHPMEKVGTKWVLWAGDGNSDRQIVYDGTANDRDPIFFDVLSDLSNTGNNYNHTAFGYLRGDYDMKGSSIYIGGVNDPDVIFFNIFQHPATTGTTIFTIFEQIPR